MSASEQAPSDERQLLARVRGSDEQDADEAFTEIWQRYEDRVQRFVHELVYDIDVVHEVSQTVWCTCWEKRRSLRVHKGFLQYLFSLSRTKAFNRLRSERRERARASTVAAWQFAEDQGVTENDAVHTLAREERDRITDAVLASMPPRQREVYQLLFDGYSEEEIAEHLKMALRTVKNHLWNANQHISNQSAKDWGER